jgi:sugar transferase (PEP-CTERM system associated)
MLRVFQHHIPMSSVAALLADGVLCFVAILLAANGLGGSSFDAERVSIPLSNVLLPATAFALFMSLLYALFGMYRQGAIAVGPAALVGRAFLAVLIGSVIAFATVKAYGGDGLALDLVFHSVLYMTLGLVSVRALFYVVRRTAVQAPRVLIVGTDAEAQAVASDLRVPGRAHRTIVGFFPTDAQRQHCDGQSPVFSRELAIDDIVRRFGVDEVIVAVREQRGGGVPMDQLLACRLRGIPVLDLAGFYERTKGEVPTESLKASWLVYGSGFVQGRARIAVKRLFDIVSSLSLLVMASPIMLLTAIAIRLEGPGPLLYQQQRVGLAGRRFMCLKFRSMRTDAERDGVARWATKGDPRVTRVGAFIRKCRIDELPQLISVLRGEMSMVGPRPERPSFVEQLEAQIPFYQVRHSVKPGVTGWAQVRYSYGASVEDARRKHQFDLYYVKNNSLFLDLLILIETVSVVLFREGAQ